MITIKEHKQAVKEINILRKNKENLNKNFERERSEVKNKFWDLHQKLKDKEYKDIEKIEDKQDNLNKEMEEKINPHSKKINEFENIINLMKVSKNQVDLNLEMYYYNYPRNDKGEIIRTKTGNYPDKEKIYLKPLSILKDNKFYKIAVYIYKNSKPKNKFTLGVIGKSIFDSKKILGFGWSYLADINENGHFKKGLKCLPTKEELIKYFEKNKDKILKKEIDKIEETIKEYKEVILNTKNKEWEIAYLESRKDYYEKSVSHGTETPEYSKIINNLFNLTTGKEKEKYHQIIKDLILNKLGDGN